MVSVLLAAMGVECKPLTTRGMSFLRVGGQREGKTRTYRRGEHKTNSRRAGSRDYWGNKAPEQDIALRYKWIGSIEEEMATLAVQDFVVPQVDDYTIEPPMYMDDGLEYVVDRIEEEYYQCLGVNTLLIWARDELPTVPEEQLRRYIHYKYQCWWTDRDIVHELSLLSMGVRDDISGDGLGMIASYI